MKCETNVTKSQSSGM